jgi:hypothetical protein
LFQAAAGNGDIAVVSLQTREIFFGHHRSILSEFCACEKRQIKTLAPVLAN